ncbi:MAG: VCBS repeat-containing protein, partial [Verrucomicrobiota bacterium]
ANTAESGVWINQGNATFAFKPLPRLAQAAPILDVSYGDFNADGRVDLVLAQNDHSIQDMHGRMDGGIGLILLGDQDQLFVPADSRTTGIVMEADTRFVEAMDLNGDQLTDLLFGGPNIPMRAFLRQ